MQHLSSMYVLEPGDYIWGWKLVVFGQGNQRKGLDQTQFVNLGTLFLNTRFKTLVRSLEMERCATEMFPTSMEKANINTK